METHPCPHCTSQMVLIDSYSKKPKTSKFKYKVRKYRCPTCDHKETIYGNQLTDRQENFE